jgi:alpha-galactosidase
MGCYENTATGTAFIWQIEHNGSWHWELSDIARLLYLHVSGPTFNENHWWKSLRPGETFTTVPVAVGCVTGGVTDAVAALTRYRRVIRRPNRDNVALPVIFNDYMNCLMGDPTTEKLRPLIAAAAEVGAEYFCIDAGWYADGSWWTDVGEWLPSQRRFPGGIAEPLKLIRDHGMIPGLWLELEVMGIHCRLAKQVPDSWFFQHRGRRVMDHGRYQLDYRNPEVRAHADRVIDRLVREYGVGYIKMDYNIDAGPGTDWQADSLGDGLLQHNRAYLAWLDSIFARYPELVIENCGSGGLRMDYALLSRHSIQSSSDQQDYRKNAVIAAACPSAVTPEQCAVWSYPLREGDREEVICNMVNALLLRIHQSGHLAELSPDRRALVKEAIDCYKRIRADIPVSLPFWPLGLPKFSDPWLAFGLRGDRKCYLAVWRMADSAPTCALPLPVEPKTVTLLYPAGGECQWSQSGSTLAVTLPQINTARLLEIKY